MKSRFLLFIVSCFFTFDGFTQVNDAALWSSVHVEKKLKGRSSLLFNETVRVVENITRVGTVFSDLGYRYKFKNKLGIAIHYRFAKKNNLDQTFSTYHRYYIDISYKQKLLKPISIALRTRIQTQYTDLHTSLNGRIPKDHIRLRLMVNYDLQRRYTPFISSEFFYQLPNAGYICKLDNIRSFAGINYKFNKRSSVDIYYMIDYGLHTINPKRYFITGIEYYIIF